MVEVGTFSKNNAFLPAGAMNGSPTDNWPLSRFRRGEFETHIRSVKAQCTLLTPPRIQGGASSAQFQSSPRIRGELEGGQKRTKSRIDAYPNAYRFETHPNMVSKSGTSVSSRDSVHFLTKDARSVLMHISLQTLPNGTYVTPRKTKND